MSGGAPDRLTGEGRLQASGGCVVARSLEVRLRPAGDRVAVAIDDRWTSGPHGRRIAARLPAEALGPLAAGVRAALAAPPVAPTCSTASTSVSVRLPLESGLLEAGASEMDEGTPPGPLLDAITAFVEAVAAAPGASIDQPPPASERAPARPSGTPAGGGPLRRAPWWLLLLGVLVGLGLYAVNLLATPGADGHARLALAFATTVWFQALSFGGLAVGVLCATRLASRIRW